MNKERKPMADATSGKKVVKRAVQVRKPLLLITENGPPTIVTVTRDPWVIVQAQAEGKSVYFTDLTPYMPAKAKQTARPSA